MNFLCGIYDQNIAANKMIFRQKRDRIVLEGRENKINDYSDKKNNMQRVNTIAVLTEIISGRPLRQLTSRVLIDVLISKDTK